MNLTIEQLRAARALKGWSQKELGDKAGFSQTAITNIESGRFRPTAETLAALQSAFEHAGLEFIDGGVRFRPSEVLVFRGEEYNSRLMDFYFSALLQSEDKEVLLSGLDLRGFEHSSFRSTVERHVQRLKDHGMSQRILIHEHTPVEDLVEPLEWHRFVTGGVFAAVTPTVVFGPYYAVLSQDQQETIVLRHKGVAANQRKIFNHLWDQAGLVAAR